MRDASSVDTSTIDAGPCPNGVTGTYLPGCLTATQPVALAGELVTDADPRCQVIGQTNGPAVCVIAATSITTTGEVRVRGSHALALVSTSTIEITHVVDAASHRKGTYAGTSGPAANHATCAPSNGVIAGEVDGSSGGGGGAGGSFGARGGDGGAGNPPNTDGGVAAIASTPPAILRGGCPGGNGGDGAMGMGGLGGDGGGAIYLLANGTITFDNGGALNASGAGGRADISGGGGGGSGGMIAIETKAMLVVQSGSAIYSIGGGGAGGNTNTSGEGGDANAIAFRGPGGFSGTAGGGGNGLDIDGLAGNGASLGGGGGGGGGGMIFVIGTKTGPGPVVPIAM